MSDRDALPEVIETARLRLRPWELGDVDDVLAYARDPEWSRFLRALPRPYTRTHAEEFLARQILQDRVERPAWAIVLDRRAVGGINLRFVFEHRRGEMGYSIGREHWSRGYVTEAARAVIDAAFRTHPDLNKVEARADVDNVASHRVMEKLGMTKEGVLRKNRFERGETVDEAWFGILREEWEALGEGG